MPRYCRIQYVFTVIALIFMFLPQTLFALPYVPLEQAQAEAELRNQTLPQTCPLSLPTSELDEFEYALEYQQVITWLPTMQVQTAGNDFGGMMEGEQDLDIIQTDNTQEALRDWARYGLRTGDTELFADNIDAAWEYILLHPAYDEEGGGNPNYYRVHNCGWGLVATMEYTNTYGDSTYMWYGDSCASYIDTWRLNWSGIGVELNPLAAGYGAGTLYLYGVWRDNQDWIDAAQEIANNVKTWIENNPNRLNANETWAMSGGTAMWGVVTALFLDDPEAGQEWIPDYTQYMDTYSGPGQWNNSWTVWYGHAWRAIHEVLGDNESFNNVLDVADFLLEQDIVDDDGGIPATEDQWQNDQSWTSAYLIWYVLEHILDTAGYDYDVAAVDFINPESRFPIGIDIEHEIVAEIANTGLNDIENVTVTITVDDFESSVTTDIPRSESSEIVFEDLWLPDPALGEMRIFTLTVDHDLDGNPDNNTYVDTFYVLPTEDVYFSIQDARGLVNIPCRIYMYYMDMEPHISQYGLLTDNTGTGTIEDVIVGNYTIEIRPQVAPFNWLLEDIEVIEGANNEMILELNPADILFVSENSLTENDDYYTIPLNSLGEYGLTYYHWQTLVNGDPTEYFSDVESILWVTGNGGNDVLALSYQDALADFMDEGKSVIMSGQNILNQWSDSDLLSDYFGVEVGEMDFADQYLQPVAGAENIHQNDSLLVVGAGGAGGQNEMDELLTVNDAVPVYMYAVTDRYGVVYQTGEGDNPYKSIFCGFGIEGINSETGGVFLTRSEFLRQMYVAVDMIDDTGIDENRNEMPVAFSVKSWPNPFNPTLNVLIESPAGGELGIAIYDILGRQVSGLHESNWHGGKYKFTWDGRNAASGTYLLKVEQGNQNIIRRVTLLK